MQRYRTYGELDDVPQIVGDTGFNRLDMLTDPALLPLGNLAVSENERFDANGTTVRGGLSRQFPAGTNIGATAFAGIYKPDAGDDQFALVTRNKLAFFRADNQTVTVANYPDGETVEAGDTVYLVQAGVGSGTLPTLYLLRGRNKTVLKFDGNTGLISVDNDFPPSDFALFIQDRIAAADWQSVHTSDFLNFTVWSLLNQFQVLKGGDDFLTCFLPFQQDYVLVGTRKGWQVAFFDPSVGTGGYSGGLDDKSFLRQLTREAGPIGPRAAIEALGKIWFITDSAIYAFVPLLDGNLTVLGKPLSAEIQPVMERMSSKYARGAAVERWGYRLYFALPISDEPVDITDITLTLQTTLGVNLPFDLPASLAPTALATITTAQPHNLAADDSVLLSGIVTSLLNGEQAVAAVLDTYRFVVAIDKEDTGAPVGNHATAQRIARRNNVIAVYNLKNDGWESIDTLPASIFADWLLAADYGTRRRLWVIDANAGPALYEELDADETGDVLGGVNLPFDLPVDLSTTNFASVAIPGRLRTRCFRWGGLARKVRGAEARATLPADSTCTLSLLARTPNNRVWTGTRNFSASQFTSADAPLRKLCGERALEAQVEITSTSGRPTIRSVLVEIATVGKVEE